MQQPQSILISDLPAQNPNAGSNIDRIISAGEIMREWLRQIWLAAYYYTHRNGILKELSQITSKIFPPENLWADETQERADCAITYGPVTVCCTRNVDRARCNRIAEELSIKFPGCVGQWRRNLCQNTSAQDCRKIKQ